MEYFHQMKFLFSEYFWCFAEESNYTLGDHGDQKITELLAGNSAHLLTASDRVSFVSASPVRRWKWS